MELDLPENQSAGELVRPEQREHSREDGEMKLVGQILLGVVDNSSVFVFYFVAGYHGNLGAWH